MDDRAHKVNSLLLDNRFVDWVLNPQSVYARYWLDWIAASSDNAALAEEAKQFLLALNTAENEGEKELGEGSTDQLWTDIQNAIDEQAVVADIAPKRREIFWIAAAACIGVVLFSAVALFQQPVYEPVTVSQRITAENHSAEVTRYNGSEKNVLVFLPDGSRITLAKGTRISYNRLMKGSKRVVQLTGEAYFDVARNPEKPFYIYTPNMVVRVLGTSFRIEASGNKESVAVKTGKVSVYLKGQDLEQSAPKILLPQQTCTYSISNNEFVTGAHTSPSKIELKVDNIPNYHFEDATIDKVFKTLEKMYAISVRYDVEKFKNCYITISLGKESLEEILEVITKTIDASFSISDSGIAIEGKGCQ